jgi:hypothetical protein
MTWKTLKNMYYFKNCNGRFIQEAAHVTVRLRQQAARHKSIFLADFCLPAILCAVLPSLGVLQFYQLRISDTNSLCARSEILTAKLMEDYGALGNDTVLIYTWVPAFQRGFYLEDRGKMLY